MNHGNQDPPPSLAVECYPASAAQTARRAAFRKALKTAPACPSFSCVCCRLIEIVIERLPSELAAAYCVKPNVLPLWPYIVPQRVLYRSSASPAALTPGPGGSDPPPVMNARCCFCTSVPNSLP